ncbi:polysaccharide biosynthesis/export family protein [Oleiphilus sp. HI0080]|nr:polysaccharide biosynthesis/export family protein [Oleiphilus sp. HI0080]
MLFTSISLVHTKRNLLKALCSQGIFLFLTLTISGCANQDVVSDNTFPDQLDISETGLTVTEEQIQQDRNFLKSLHTLENNEYRIASGDKFNIYVYNESDLDTKGIIVKMDGTITCKLIGEIQVKDLSIPNATAEIEAALKKYIHYPKVSLIPYEMRSSSFTIMGKVTKPGFYYFDGSIRLADAIAKAEGLSVGVFDNNTIELADLQHSFVRRGDDILPIDFDALLRKGDALMNIPLINGDYIFIPSAMNQEVYVIGEVNKQGYFGFKPNMTAGRLLAHAEGVKNSAADEIVVIRGNLQHPRLYKLSRDEILTGTSRDFRLEPNDIVYVPKGILGQWNAILSEIVPTLEAAVTAFDIDREISVRVK